jgi:hypothetical protein
MSERLVEKFLKETQGPYSIKMHELENLIVKNMIDDYKSQFLARETLQEIILDAAKEAIDTLKRKIETAKKTEKLYSNSY